MDPTLSDTQTYLQEAVAGAIARDASLAVVREWLSHDDLEPAFRLAVRQGWTGIGLDEDSGGQGGGATELAVAAEHLGRGAVPWDQMLTTCLLGPLLASAGGRGGELAQAGASGEASSVLCVDARSPRTGVCELEVHEDSVDGTVPFVLGATRASTFIVAASAAGSDQVELLEIARDAKGVSTAARRLVDRSRSLADVTFSSTPYRSLGTVEGAAVRRAIQVGVVLVAADMLGSASRLLEMTTDYVSDRKQFGVPVGSFQAVKHAAAQMLVDVEGMRSAVQFASWAVETGAADAELHAAIAGAYCSAAAASVADRALFLHGAIGYTWEHDLQLLFKRAKSGASLFGSADWHRDQMCEALGL